MTNVSFNMPGTPLSKRLQKAFISSFPAAEQTLRASALDSGWPTDAANDISISDAKITIGDTAANYEFGLPSQPPSPVIRRNDVASKAEIAMFDDMVSMLKKEGVL